MFLEIMSTTESVLPPHQIATFLMINGEGGGLFILWLNICEFDSRKIREGMKHIFFSFTWYLSHPISILSPIRNLP